MKTFIPAAGFTGLLVACLAIAGCINKSKDQAGGPQAPPPAEVLISVPVRRTVTDFEDFPGRVEAVNSIEIRARVTGYLTKVAFKEGEDVKKGQILFEIDPRLYDAELAGARATMAQAEAHQKRLDADFKRALNLLPNGAIGREDFDKIAGDRAEATASVEVAQASLKKATLNKVFTRVEAPIDGRISRRFIDPNNLVKADDTILTTLVSLDPIYAYFDLDERTTLRLQKLIRGGKIKWSANAAMPVLLGLADEGDASRAGVINFADNRIDPDTGTWRLRGQFVNHDHALTPGQFVHIRLPIGEPYGATLVSEQALGTDQGQKFLYVVDANNKVAYRAVKVGRLQEGLRVITEGLTEGEKVVVNGLQRVRPGATVLPKMIEMPVVGQHDDKMETGVKNGNGSKEEKKKKKSAEGRP